MRPTHFPRESIAHRRTASKVSGTGAALAQASSTQTRFAPSVTVDEYDEERIRTFSFPNNASNVTNNSAGQNGDADPSSSSTTSAAAAASASASNNNNGINGNNNNNIMNANGIVISPSASSIGSSSTSSSSTTTSSAAANGASTSTSTYILNPPSSVPFGSRRAGYNAPEDTPPKMSSHRFSPSMPYPPYPTQANSSSSPSSPSVSASTSTLINSSWSPLTFIRLCYANLRRYPIGQLLYAFTFTISVIVFFLALSGVGHSSFVPPQATLSSISSNFHRSTTRNNEPLLQQQQQQPPLPLPIQKPVAAAVAERWNAAGDPPPDGTHYRIRPITPLPTPEYVQQQHAIPIGNGNGNGYNNNGIGHVSRNFKNNNNIKDKNSNNEQEQEDKDEDEDNVQGVVPNAAHQFDLNDATILEQNEHEPAQNKNNIEEDADLLLQHDLEQQEQEQLEADLQVEAIQQEQQNVLEQQEQAEADADAGEQQQQLQPDVDDNENKQLLADDDDENLVDNGINNNQDAPLFDNVDGQQVQDDTPLLNDPEQDQDATRYHEI